MSDDPRLSHIFSKLRSSFKQPTTEKFDAFTANENTLELCYNFLDGETLTLYFSDNRGSLKVQQDPPTTLKTTQFLYITKADTRAVSEETYSTSIITGDLTTSPLDHMARTTMEVYLPLLTNPVSQDQWSEMVAKDIMETFDEFVANVQVSTSGREARVTERGGEEN